MATQMQSYEVAIHRFFSKISQKSQETRTMVYHFSNIEEVGLDS